MGIAFGGTTRCVEELTKLCLEHPNEVYMGEINGNIRFISVDEAWDYQQEFLNEGKEEALWLKHYYESMYRDIDSQKRLMCAVIELTGICTDCGVWTINKNLAYKLFDKWNVINALMTEVFEIFLKKYYNFSLET